MKNFENLKVILESFDKNRDNSINKGKLSDPNNREEYAQAIAECFKPCSAKILAGHFRVTNNAGGTKQVRNIYPTAIELYYHEEGNGRFKDPIMYHTTDRKKYDFYKNKDYYEEYYVKHRNNDSDKKTAKRKDYFFVRENRITEIPYFPFGSLNPHSSGIDITFEKPEKRYRASCLIREYQIQFADEGKKILIKNSTDIYDDMLLCGITLDNADWIEWKDVDLNTIVLEDKPELIKRKNVCAYEKYNDEPELWQKKVKERDANGKPVSYEKCTFNWQFRIKNPQNNN